MIDSHWEKEISLLGSVLHLVGLSDSPFYRGVEQMDETLAHILYECEALASLRHVYLAPL
jgi:hypothetical protein